MLFRQDRALSAFGAAGFFGICGFFGRIQPEYGFLFPVLKASSEQTLL